MTTVLSTKTIQGGELRHIGTAYGTTVMQAVCPVCAVRGDAQGAWLANASEDLDVQAYRLADQLARHARRFHGGEAAPRSMAAGLLTACGGNPSAASAWEGRGFTLEGGTLLSFARAHGWRIHRMAAGYYFVLTNAAGEYVTYCEGDVLLGDDEGAGEVWPALSGTMHEIAAAVLA